MIVGVLTNYHTQYTSDRNMCIFYLIQQHSKFLLHTLQVFYMCWTEGTDQNRHWNSHRWHASNSLERTQLSCLSYVYWTVHHLDSWVKRETNLMSFALLFLYLMLNMFGMLIHPSSGACDLCAELFRGLYWSGSMCVGVTLWYGWGGGIRMQVEGLVLQPAYGHHTTTAIPQRNSKTHRTRSIQPMK